MVLKIEEGKFYQTRDGRKVGPLEGHDNPAWPFTYGPEFYSNGVGDASHARNGQCYGSRYGGKGNGGDLVAEWQDEPTGPVSTVTRREIVPGVYGRVYVDSYTTRSDANTRTVMLTLTGHETPGYAAWRANMTADELRSAAMVLSQLAEALDDNKDAGK